MNYNEEIEKLSPKMKEFYNYAMNVESLSEEEEKKLFKKIKKNDQDAKRKVLEANIKMVFPIAYKYINHDSSCTFEDLIQIGCKSLIDTVDTYHDYANKSFEAFASFFIELSLKAAKESEKINDIKYSKDNNVLENYKKEFIEENGRRPSVEEINSFSYGVKTGESDVQDLSVNFEEDFAIKNYVELAVLQKDKKDSILNEKEQQILILRYGLDGGPSLTYDEIGKQLGLSRARINQIEVRAMHKIRSNFGPNIFKAKIFVMIKETLNSSYKMLLDKMSYEEAAVYLIKKGLIPGVTLTDKEIAELLNISLEQVEVLYQNAEIALSLLDQPKTLKKLNN